MGSSSWHEKKCDPQDYEGVFVVGGQAMASDPREAILDNILGDDHVGLTVLYCFRDISVIMTI
jgi:hypothetical protein